MSLRRMLLLAGFGASVLLGGCGATPGVPTGALVAKVGISGTVHGGQQPIGYSTVQLYTVGVGGDGSPSTPMLIQAVQSDSGGNFSITGDYSCTNSNATQVYLTATGGDPTSYSTNANLAMMVALGPCSGLGPNTFVTINELSTVAAVAALQPYMTGVASIGSGTSDATGLAAAMTLASEFVGTATGISPGTNVPSGYTVPYQEIDTLGDLIAGCINSAGGVSGDKTPCGTLFQLTTVNGVAPTDTITALLNIANYPASNTTQLYDAVPTIVPFEPTLGAPPASFAVALQATTALTVMPASLSFGMVTQASPSAAQAVTLQNTGAATISLSSIAVGGTNAGDFTATSGCGLTLTAGASCSVSVVATPGGLGPRTGSLVVTSNAPQSPQSVGLSVTGVTGIAGPVVLGSSTLYWDIVSTLQDISVTNQGTLPVSISSIAVNNSNFAIYGGTCGTTVPAQSSCTITVESMAFSSDSFGNAQTYTGTLTVIDNAGSGIQTASLSSTNSGALSPQILMTDTAVGSSTTTTVSYGSPGQYTSPVSISYATVTGTNAGDFTIAASQTANGGGTSACQYFPTAGNGKKCNLAITFTPQASGSRAARLIADSTNEYVLLVGATTAADFTLYSANAQLASGQALPLISAVPLMPDPNSTLGSTQAVKITNVGVNAFLFSYSFSGTNAAIMTMNANGCTTLATNASCTVTVGFTPSNTVGTYTATLTITDANSGVSHSFPVTANTSYWSSEADVANGVVFSSQPAQTTSAPQYITVADPNGYPDGHASVVSLQAGGQFVLPQGGNCAASLTQTCSIAIEFSPAAAGSVVEQGTVKDLVTGVTTPFNISGTAR